MDGKCIVYIAVFNGKAFIKETLDSVLAQTYKNFVVYITDDCSDEETYDILREYRDKFPDKIILNRNKYNQGVGYNSHKCFADYHDGDYAGLLGHDDMWAQDYLEKMIVALQKNDAVAAFGKVVYVNDHGTPINKWIFRHRELEKLDRHELLLQLMLGNFLCAPSAVLDMTKLEREKIAQYWGYNNDRLQDHELWMNLTCLGCFTYVREACCYYRIHEDNLSDGKKLRLQATLEFYGQMRRLLYSPQFMMFAKESRDMGSFLENVVQRLCENFGYSPLLKVLVMDFCEKLLNEGYDFSFLHIILSQLYQDTGVLNKAIKGGRPLPTPQRLVVCGGVKNANIEYLRQRSYFFQVVDGMENCTPKSFCLVDSAEIEYMLNKEGLAPYLASGQAAIFCRDSEEVALKEKYSNMLIIKDSVYEGGLEHMLLSYIEDYTAIYGNGLLRNVVQVGVNYGVISCCVSLAGKPPRWVSIPGSIKVSRFFTGSGQNVEVAATEEREGASVFHLEEAGAPDVLGIELTNETEAPHSIVINNEVFILDSLSPWNGGYSGNYKRLCFFDASRTYLDCSMNQNTVWREEYFNLCRSRSVRYALKLKKILRKLHLV